MIFSPFMAIYDLSDVDVVERSKYDMSFKYFLQMAPKESVIELSSLTKFRKLRLKDLNLLDMLINKTVEIAIEKEGSISEYTKVKEQVNLLKEAVADDIEPFRISEDQDAKVGHKSADSSFFGYKHT